MKVSTVKMLVATATIGLSGMASAQITQCPPGQSPQFDPRTQTFVCVPTSTGGGSSVPEPGTLALLGLGIAGAALVAKRRKNRLGK